MVISEILALFINIFTADHKYCLFNRENLQESIQMQLSKKRKTKNFEFFATFVTFTSNFKQFERKMTLIAYVFP